MNGPFSLGEKAGIRGTFRSPHPCPLLGGGGYNLLFAKHCISGHFLPSKKVGTHAQLQSRAGKNSIERNQAIAMIRRDREMQRITGTEPRGVLVRETGCRGKIEVTDGHDIEGNLGQGSEHGEYFRPVSRVELTCANLDR